ncbi:hypothetical protein BLA29_009935 [Euroglyphus maynei]|uniref:Uncharacterized protein n=1 Tax=Euroglyphus maynei TaxID=6958 RepID=A0A1Y3BUC4_EURMA|nr:hypothetical protein BLA29_009935 [Euroglyphus maynei]
MVNAIYQNSFYGLGSRLPMKYTNAIVTGTNVCGTFTSLMNIATIALSPNKRIAAKYFLYYLRNTHLQQSPTTTTVTVDGTTTTETEMKTTKTENQNLLTTTTTGDGLSNHQDLESSKLDGKQERPPYLYK